MSFIYYYEKLVKKVTKISYPVNKNLHCQFEMFIISLGMGSNTQISASKVPII